ncbi:hypothetical protein Tco_0604640 [Tanacetum coccineum]
MKEDPLCVIEKPGFYSLQRIVLLGLDIATKITSGGRSIGQNSVGKYGHETENNECAIAEEHDIRKSEGAKSTLIYHGRKIRVPSSDVAQRNVIQDLSLGRQSTKGDTAASNDSNLMKGLRVKCVCGAVAVEVEHLR